MNSRSNQVVLVSVTFVGKHGVVGIFNKGEIMKQSCSTDITNLFNWNSNFFRLNYEVLLTTIVFMYFYCNY